jgi:hypothetical protein
MNIYTIWKKDQFCLPDIVACKLKEYISVSQWYILDENGLSLSIF